MNKRYLKLVFLTLFTSAASAQVYVTPTGGGTKDGSSWANAFEGTQLQQAINLSVGGTQVWVAKGTYKPTQSLSATGFLTDGVTEVTARDNAFILTAGAAIYGGFDGTEVFGAAAIAARDFAANETILSGDLNGNDLADDGDNYHVVAVNASLNPILDGFTIKHGFANGPGSVTVGAETISRNFAAGIIVISEQAGLNLRNLYIHSNKSVGNGGGIYSKGVNGDVTIDKCVFKDNSALMGGHIYVLNGKATIKNSTLENATVTGSGGAIYYAGTSDWNITDCTFKNNKASTAGHYYIAGGTSTIKNTTFENGTASGNGGAIFASGNATSLDIVSSKFNTNSAGGSTGGGAIYNGTSMTISDTEFTSNTATASGGAIYNINATNITKSKFYANTSNGAIGGGAIYSSTTVKISKTDFRSNTAGAWGGALYLNSTAAVASEHELSNCLFYNNIGNGTGSENQGGGALYVTYHTSTTTLLTAINNTFYANKSPNAPSGAISFNADVKLSLKFYNNIFYGNIGSGGVSDIRKKSDPILDFQNNLFQVSPIVSSGDDNYKDNIVNHPPSPLFQSITDGDYNFLYPISGSIANEEGSNALYATVGDVTTDTHFAGYARLAGTNIDMGAIEYASVLPVTIKTFTAKLANNRTQLRWIVGTEDNVSHYEIERSQNGTDFTKVAEVKATLANAYSVTDANPQIGVNYYRLKTIDNDGKFSHYGSLQTVTLNALASAGVKVYPNPVKGNQINLAMGDLAAGTYQYKLINSSGGVAQQGMVSYDGTKNISLTTTLPAGLYVMHLDNGSMKVAVKLIKQ